MCESSDVPECNACILPPASDWRSMCYFEHVTLKMDACTESQDGMVALFKLVRAIKMAFSPLLGS